MECKGIYIDPYTQNKLFNSELALSNGFSIITNNGHAVDDPEKLRKIVEQGLRRCHPYVKVTFLDMDSELEIGIKEVEELGEYSLLIVADAPIFSSGRVQ